MILESDFRGSQAREWCHWNHGTPKEVSQLEANTSMNKGKGGCGLCDRHDVLRHSSALNHETDDLGFNEDWGIGDQVISTNCNGERNKRAANPHLVQMTPIWISGRDKSWQLVTMLAKLCIFPFCKRVNWKLETQLGGSARHLALVEFWIMLQNFPCLKREVAVWSTI